MEKHTVKSRFFTFLDTTILFKSLTFVSFFRLFSADGDPHFVIDFPSSKFSVCFNIDGEPGDILRLVSDHKESGEQPSKTVACGGKL